LTYVVYIFYKRDLKEHVVKMRYYTIRGGKKKPLGISTKRRKTFAKTSEIMEKNLIIICITHSTGLVLQSVIIIIFF